MTSYTWQQGTSGDWDNGSNWTPSGGPPTELDTATFNGTATETITEGNAAYAQSIYLYDPNATIVATSYGGTQNALITSFFDLSAGTFVDGTGGQQTGGQLSEATVIVTGGKFVCDGGFLNDVTYDGTLDLSEAGSAITLEGGSTTINGTVNATGAGDFFGLNDDLIFNDTINLGSSNEGSPSEIALSGSLTLGPNALLDENGYGLIQGGGVGVTNQGNIYQVGSDSILTFATNLGESDEILNEGMITAASSGGELLIDSGNTFVNSGTITILNGDTVAIDATTTNLDGTIDGDSLFETEGATTISSGLTTSGSVEWENTGTVTQSVGTVFIGDSNGDSVILDNVGTYDITDDSGISDGSSTTSNIENAGLFEKTGGTGTSVIGPSVTNDGTIRATSGKIEFQNAVIGDGKDTSSGPRRSSSTRECIPPGNSARISTSPEAEDVRSLWSSQLIFTVRFLISDPAIRSSSNTDGCFPLFRMSEG